MDLMAKRSIITVLFIEYKLLIVNCRALPVMAYSSKREGYRKWSFSGKYD